MSEQDYIAQIEKQLQGVAISKDDKEKVLKSFVKVDVNKDGYLKWDEVRAAFEAAGQQSPPMYKVLDAIRRLDMDNDNRLGPAEYAKLYGQLFAVESFLKDTVTEDGHATVEGTQHSFSNEDMVAICNWINQNLQDDPDSNAHGLPIKPTEESLFNALADGFIVCKMINLSRKDTIDERAMNKQKHSNRSLQIDHEENLKLALNSASAIGCSAVTLDDWKEKKTQVLLRLLWQIIESGLFAAFDLATTPALAGLLQEGEVVEELMKLYPEQLLLRWMNYHLEKSAKYKNGPNGGKEITNFSGDIMDSYAYLCLFEQIQPQPEDNGFDGNMIVIDMNIHPGTDKDSMVKRAKYMLNEAENIKCRSFVTEFDVSQGNHRLNLAFVANLFNTYPFLNDAGDKEITVETRDEKTSRNWMNSLGVSPRVGRLYLYDDLTDGIVFTQLYEIIKPGIMKNKKINQPPFLKIGGRMKMVENCQMIVTVGQQELKYSLVGISGADIYNKTRTLTFALIWQIMRGYTLGVVEELCGYRGLTEKDVIDWVNTLLSTSGKSSSICSFKDPCISTSIPVLDLVDAVGGPGTIDYSHVKLGYFNEERESNAKYAVSMARKIGARFYAQPADLREVNEKMVMTVFTSIMAVSIEKRKE